MEAAGDLGVPGFVPWKHSRSYRSGRKAAQGYVLRDEAGKRWEGGRSTAYLYFDGSNNAKLNLGSERSIEWAYDQGSWTPLHGSQASLVFSQNDFCPGEDVYVVRMPGSQPVLVFKKLDQQKKYVMLYRVTDQYNQKHITYDYDTQNLEYRVTSITLSHGPSVSVGHCVDQTNDERQCYVALRDDDNAPVSGSVYVYHDGDVHADDCGSGGDLLLVYTCDDVVGVGAVSQAVQAESTEIPLADDRNAPNSYTYGDGDLEDCQLIIVEGANAGDVRVISSSDDNTATVASAFPAAIANGTRFMIARGPIKATHYRYYRSTSGNGREHQVKMVLGPAAVERVLNMSQSVLSSAGDLLDKSDTDSLDEDAGTSDDTVADYADRQFTYYVSNVDTSDVDTPWGGNDENLESRYGGSNLNEFVDGIGRVHTETVSTDCAGCGGGGRNLRFTYYYMTVSQDPVTSDKVTQIVVEDVSTADGSADVYRKVRGLNEDGVALREVLVANQGSGVNDWKYWCRSKLVYTTGKLANSLKEERGPSVHKMVDTADEVKGFLNPTAMTLDPQEQQTNDEWTQQSGTGVIYCYHYWCDSGGSGNYYLCDATFRNVGSATEYMLESWDYGDGADNALPTASYVYRDDDVVYDGSARAHRSDAAAIETEYTYTFHDQGVERKLKTKTTTYPDISSQNGPATAYTRKEYYDEKGKLRWVQDAQERVTYYSYHPDFGTLAYVMQDVDTDALPTDITQGDNSGPGDSDVKWEAWTENSGNAPFTQTANNAVQMVTKTEYDATGRQVRVEGPKSINTTVYTVDAETPVTYTAYVGNETRVYPAWDSTNHEPRLPVRVSRTDAGGNATITYTFNASATQPQSVSLDLDDNNRPTGLDTVPLSAFLSLTKHNYNSKGQLESRHDFYSIPHDGDFTASNFGTEGTHYVKTAYTYDSQGRTSTVTAPDGTITETIYDGLGRVSETKVGITDHMVTVSKVYYDGATTDTLIVGDGNLTQIVAYAAAGTTYATEYHYDDYRNRRDQIRGADNIAVKYTLDNLGRVTAEETYYDHPTEGTRWQVDSGELISRTETSYDKLGRVYKTVTCNVVENSAGSNRLTAQNWYDGNGRIIKASDPNGLFRKTAFDGVGRAVSEYLCYDTGDSGHGDADDVTGDTVIEQAETVRDRVGNVIVTTSYQRKDGGSGYGSLTTGNARRTYLAQWYDDAGRFQAVADYGTNGVSRPSSPPSPNSSGYVVTKQEYAYDASDNGVPIVKTINNRNIATWKFLDDLGRVTKVVENYSGSGTPGSTDYDVNRTTLYGYDGKGRLETITARNSNGSSVEDQVTRYYYDPQAHTASPEIYRNDLVWAVTYPDSDDDDTYNPVGSAGSRFDNGTDNQFDRVEFTYDRLGRRKTVKDQRTIKHQFTYDSGGRLIADQVLNGQGGQPGWPSDPHLDNAVKTITFKYDQFGKPTKVTSHGNATDDPDNTDSVLNQVAFAYDGDDAGDLGWGSVKTSWQAHDDEVTPSGASQSPKVQYAWEDGVASNEAKYVRLDYVTYPSGWGGATVVHHNYATTGVGQVLSRLENLASSGSPSPDQKYAQYGYLGAGTIYKVEHPAVTDGLTLTYDPDGDGSYGGFDQFGRVVGQKWVHDGSAIDEYAYGYDYGSNRTYRDNTRTTGRDWKYEYDSLDRLSDARRGTLDNPPSNGLTSTGFRQQWEVLEALGNWKTFNQDDNGAGGTWELVQSRSHNKVNEIDTNDRHDDTPGESISASTGANWVDPAHDAAGNVTFCPRPGKESETAYADEALHLVYDCWGRVVEVWKDSGSGNAGSLVTTGGSADTQLEACCYDGLGRRIAKTDSAANVTYDYYYNESWQVLEVRKDQTGQDANVYKQYVWDARYIDAPVVRFRDGNTDGDLTDEGVDDTLYFMQDANFSVTGLVEPDGDVAERYEYDPYGKVTILDGATGGQTDWELDDNQLSDVDNDLLYCGYAYDAETGLYHVRFRVYHPTLGRWVQRDPAYSEGLRLYEYVAAAPPVARDPLGLVEVNENRGIAVDLDLLVRYEAGTAAAYTRPNIKDPAKWFEITTEHGMTEQIECRCGPDKSNPEYCAVFLGRLRWVVGFDIVSPTYSTTKPGPVWASLAQQVTATVLEHEREHGRIWKENLIDTTIYVHRCDCDKQTAEEKAEDAAWAAAFDAATDQLAAAKQAHFNLERRTPSFRGLVEALAKKLGLELPKP